MVYLTYLAVVSILRRLNLLEIPVEHPVAGFVGGGERKI